MDNFGQWAIPSFIILSGLPFPSPVSIVNFSKFQKELQSSFLLIVTIGGDSYIFNKWCIELERAQHCLYPTFMKSMFEFIKIIFDNAIEQ